MVFAQTSTTYPHLQAHTLPRRLNLLTLNLLQCARLSEFRQWKRKQRNANDGARSKLKITDVSIEVVRRTLPDTGLDSDLGRFFGEVEQGVLRIQTNDGIEGNCFVGDFRGGGHGQFGPILNVLKPEIVGRDPFERERLWNRLPMLSGRRGLNMNAWRRLMSPFGTLQARQRERRCTSCWAQAGMKQKSMLHIHPDMRHLRVISRKRGRYLRPASGRIRYTRG